MKIYTVCDRNYKQIVKTPIKEQAINFAINKAKRTQEIYGVGEGAFKYVPQDWYNQIGTFQYLDFGEFPVYRFEGGDRIADSWEIKNGSDNRKDLEI